MNLLRKSVSFAGLPRRWAGRCRPSRQNRMKRCANAASRTRKSPIAKSNGSLDIVFFIRRFARDSKRRWRDWRPHTQFFQPRPRQTRPVPISLRTRWAGVEHAGNFWPIAWENSPRTGFSKPAYAQQPFRLQNADDLSQMIIAAGKQFLLFYG